MKYIPLMLFYILLSYCTVAYLDDVFSPSVASAGEYLTELWFGALGISGVMYILMNNTK